MDIRSDTTSTLAFHHYPVLAKFMTGETEPRQETKQRRKRKDWRELRSPAGRKSLSQEVSRLTAPLSRCGSLSQRWQATSSS
eukprot:6263258-Pyramimonas_sp.AAC.1